MASSLEELLAKDGFKGSRRMTRSRSSFHHGASSEPLYSLEGRYCVSGERIRTQRTKSDASINQITSGQLKTGTHHTAKNTRSRGNAFLRDKMDAQLKNEDEKNSCSDKDSGVALDTNSPEYMPRDEITEVIEQESSRVEDTYSKQVSAKRGKEKNFNELVEDENWEQNPVKDAKVQSRSSSMNMLGHSSESRKNINSQKESYTRSNSKSIDYRSRNKNSTHADAMQEASSLALDEVAVQAVVSILNGYIKRFPQDEDFRSTLRHKCFSSLNFIELEEENFTETKVIRSLEQAIEAIEQAAEEPISATYLKRTTMQLSIITGLSLNDLKHNCTCGIPNYKLSACAHLYLSVVYMMQKKNKVSAKHLLQVFCDSPFQARTILLPELWEHLFSPQLSHLKAWYNKEAGALIDAPSKTRKVKLLQKVYNEHLDSGTHIFAVYYKDWLTDGGVSPPIPSIGIPSVSVTGSQEGSSLGHSFESSSSFDPISPQPMVSKKLYDSMFGSLIKPGVYQVKDIKDDDNLENSVKGSYGSTFVKHTLTYESETVEFTDQDIEDFTQGVAVDTIKPLRGTSTAAVEEWQKRNLSNNINNSFSMQTNLSSHNMDALPQEKANELVLKKPNKTNSAHEGSYFPSIPQEFICPLTGNLFEEPITLETGQTFEREAIKSWFEKGNRTCPVTGNTLECLAIPLSNLILKRLIDKWKSDRFDYILDLASQTVENSEELKLKKRDEAAVFKLGSLFSSLKEEDKSTYAKQLITVGVLPFLFRRFEQGNVEEKSHVVSLLLNCIQVDSSCIYQTARSVNRKCLVELLHKKEVTPTTNAILFLTELLSMERRKDVTSFISDLVGEKVFNIMQILLIYLKNSTPFEKPLIAVLLLHFDVLVCSNNNLHQKTLLGTLFSASLHLPFFVSIISQLKGILENGKLELKTLASLSLLNFSKISECKTLLRTMPDDITPLLHGLVEVTWTAKQLHAIGYKENL